MDTFKQAQQKHIDAINAVNRNSWKSGNQGMLIDTLHKETPDEYKDQHFYNEVCLQLGMYSIPIQFITYDICSTSLINNGFTYRYLPEHFKRDEGLCWLALEHEPRAIQTVLEMMPNMLTIDLCKMVIEKAPWFLNIIPEEFKTQKLCIDATHDEHFKLKYVPEQFRIDEFYAAMIANHGLEYFKDIPAENYTPEIFIEAIRRRAKYTKEVPEIMWDAQMALQVLDANPKAFELIPDEFKDDLAVKAIEDWPNNVAFYPLPHDALLTEKCQLDEWNQLLSQGEDFSGKAKTAIRQSLLDTLKEELKSAGDVSPVSLDALQTLMEHANRHGLAIKTLEKQIIKLMEPAKETNLTRSTINTL